MGVSHSNDNGKNDSRRNAWLAKKTREPQSLLCHASPQGTAHGSAMTQFFAVDSYFAHNACDAAVALFTHEVTEDFLGCTAPEEAACMETFVKRRVGKEYGSWPKMQTLHGGR